MLGLTIGDAAGVGPELILGTWAAVRSAGPAVVYGHHSVLSAALRSLIESHGPERWPKGIVAVATPGDAASAPDGYVPVIDVHEASPSWIDGAYPWGETVRVFGRLQYNALVHAIRDARASRIDAIVTAPWNKALLGTAGLPPTGHTEVLEAQTGSKRAVMLLAGDVLRVALATVHVPLRDVPAALTEDGLFETGEILCDALIERFGLPAPRIAFCGLNPHAGEGGLMGDEEARVIGPALERLRAVGIDAVGPFPADTLFARAANGALPVDAIVAMYHDQGLAPLKLFHFGEAANVTLGLPIVRTSVDHGTAYDIAGRGVADTSSFAYAVSMARALSAR